MLAAVARWIVAVIAGSTASLVATGCLAAPSWVGGLVAGLVVFLMYHMPCAAGPSERRP